MYYWHETDNLSLEDDGTLHARVVTDRDEETGEVLDTELKRLGDIEDVEDEAGELGFGAEYDEHLDLWRDSQRCDYAGQVRHDYRVLQGF